MLQFNKKQLNKKQAIAKLKPSTICGFSLIEAMVATLIVSIAFTGVYTLTLFSARQVLNSEDRQKLQLVANQIFEIIESDISNISSYATNIATCTAPASGEARKYILRPYDWCRRLNSEVGSAQVSDVRTINVTNSGTEKIVTITLTSKNAANKVIVKRTYE